MGWIVDLGIDSLRLDGVTGGFRVRVQSVGWFGSSASALESGGFWEKLLGAIPVEVFSGFFALL